MKKLAFIIQRYGLDVVGGAENHCRQIVEHLQNEFSIEVLTSCAKDHHTWENVYPSGVDFVNSVKVIRFRTIKKRNMKKFNAFSQKALNCPGSSRKEERWLRLQGPICPNLIKYIKKHRLDYDLFIFFTYLYWPTIKGFGLVKEKAILIPTLHNEPPVYLRIYEELFNKVKAVIFNTLEEKRFAEKRFQFKSTFNNIIGVGIDSQSLPLDSKSLDKFRIKKPFILYAGRIEESKNCDLLFNYIIEFNKKSKIKMQLLLIGKALMKIPQNPNISFLGFVTKEDKLCLMQEATAICIPSEYESLSMTALESWSVATPIMVNDDSKVLTKQCEASGGGLPYKTLEDFTEKLNLLLLKKGLRKKMGKKGQKYVQEKYSWNIIKDALTTFFKKVITDSVSKNYEGKL